MSYTSDLLATSRRQRACDMCRRRRARCDGTYQSGSKCSNCTLQGFSCTYVEQSTRRSTSKKYVSRLEDRLHELEKALQALCPEETNYEEWIESLCEDQDDTVPRSTSRAKSELLKNMATARTSHFEDSPHSGDDEDDSAVLASSLRTDRFFGKSSGEEFVRTALSIRQQYIGRNNRPILTHRREEFWIPRPWEIRPNIASTRRFSFPEPDLAKELVELYFVHVNLFTPLLHRLTFDKSLRDGLHYSREGFADVYLLVCSNGARFSSDPRARSDGEDSQLAAGWKWYNQVETGKTSLLSLPSLYDIQVACLRMVFIQNSTSPMVVWPLLGMAIRLAQDVGAHRRKSTTPTVEDELWKRAFWVLFCGDRLMSLSMGRPFIIQEEDFDLDLPIDCDDDYWEHPDPQKRFKQPPNKPSLITAFIMAIKLTRILATCGRAIYPISKASISLIHGDKYRRSDFVAELDASVNQWLASMPPHLSWDPLNQTNDKFFNQSAMLYSMCYFTQIFIHRPPILSLKGHLSPQALKSLGACTSAAHACIDIAEAQLQRGLPQAPIGQLATFNSCLVLLLKVWGEKAGSPTQSPSTSTDENPDLEQVRKGLHVLRSLERQWIHAGRFRDTLLSLFPGFEAPDCESGTTDTQSPASQLDILLHSNRPRLPHANSKYSGLPASQQDAYTEFALAGIPLSGNSPWNHVISGWPNSYIADESDTHPPEFQPVGLPSLSPGGTTPVTASTCTPNGFGEMDVGQTSSNPDVLGPAVYHGLQGSLHGDECFYENDVFGMWVNDAPPDVE
ncbi:unnamed protein product [Cyclocybe aegerita]|uniref:Zn(2)-C6 fungal-type domain-containing protein n=1 Tax=Cyclocybe aegerita TaxID=1973307 RepID=A0A8S0WYV6_CYCAE|nr:unnamed protein product [Cyclocybe aegerita]